MSLLLSHAEDLLMSADIMSELAKEFQGLYEEIQAIKQTIQSTGF
jgi:PTS system cellobiose-specific IIA component